MMKPVVSMRDVDMDDVCSIVSATQYALTKSGKSYQASVFLQRALVATNGTDVIRAAHSFVTFRNNVDAMRFDFLSELEHDDDDDDDAEEDNNE